MFERNTCWDVYIGQINKWFEGSEGDFVMSKEPCFAYTVISAFFG